MRSSSDSQSVSSSLKFDSSPSPTDSEQTSSPSVEIIDDPLRCVRRDATSLFDATPRASDKTQPPDSRPREATLDGFDDLNISSHADHPCDTCDLDRDFADRSSGLSRVPGVIRCHRTSNRSTRVTEDELVELREV